MTAATRTTDADPVFLRLIVTSAGGHFYSSCIDLLNRAMLALIEEIPPIRLMMMIRRSMGRPRRRRSIRPPANPYMLVSRGLDGRLRTERFKSAAEYRLRLAALRSGERAVSLDELIELLDV